MRHLLAVDLDAPVLVVVPSIFGVGAQASSSGHALGVDAVLENTCIQDHGAHGLGPSAKILFAEAEENNLGIKAFDERWGRWDTSSLCEQEYHGVVRCALGWACWRTYVGRPERDMARINAMQQLGTGLYRAGHDDDALSVKETELSLLRRIGADENDILTVQNNLANTYDALGKLEQALSMRRDVYDGHAMLLGEEHQNTLTTAKNYATSLIKLDHFEEARSLLRKTIPVARRVLGDSRELTLQMRQVYAIALYGHTGATLDHLREAVMTLVETERVMRRVLGGAHPLTTQVELALRDARARLRAREASA